MTFQEKLGRLMRLHGLSGRALAAALQLSNSTVAGWSRGAAPRPEQLKSLAAHFGVDPEVLVNADFDLPEGTTTAIYKGEYKLTPEMMHAVRQSINRDAYGKMWESFSPRIPGLIKRLKAITKEADDIRAELEDVLPGASDLTAKQQKAIQVAESRMGRQRKPDQSSEPETQFGAGR